MNKTFIILTESCLVAFATTSRDLRLVLLPSGRPSTGNTTSMRIFHPLAFASALFSSLVNAGVTVYYQVPLADSTTTASSANYTGAAAYDPTVLTPPPVPAGLTTQFGIQLSSSSAAVQGLSIPHQGSFMGFSIEFTVVNQICESMSYPVAISTNHRRFCSRYKCVSPVEATRFTYTNSYVIVHICRFPF